MVFFQGTSAGNPWFHPQNYGFPIDFPFNPFWDLRFALIHALLPGMGDHEFLSHVEVTRGAVTRGSHGAVFS